MCTLRDHNFLKNFTAVTGYSSSSLLFCDIVELKEVGGCACVFCVVENGTCLDNVDGFQAASLWPLSAKCDSKVSSVLPRFSVAIKSLWNM